MNWCEEDNPKDKFTDLTPCAAVLEWRTANAENQDWGA